MEDPADAEGDLVAQDEVLLHRGAAQVEIAVLESKLFRRIRPVLDDEGRSFGA